MGDITLNITATVKGLRPPCFIWRIGPMRDTTPNGDGSGVAAAVGPLGTAVLTATITPTNGASVEKSEAINVIAGDAAAFNFTFGAEEEVTPDEA